MKKLTAILLALSLCACVCAAFAENAAVGAWAVTDDIAMTEEAAAALNKATEGFVGSKIEPVALLGTQVVSGTNYCILCRLTTDADTPVISYAMIWVYQKLDGTAEILDIVQLDMGIPQANG